MPTVVYLKTVSDANLKVVLQRLADGLNRDVRVHSGDRSFVPPGGGTTSLHLAKRAADLHVIGLTFANIFQFLRTNMNTIFDANEAYEVVHHGDHTGTGGPHIHVGRYGQGRQGYGRKLGIRHAQLAGMTAEHQLDVVKVYFQQWPAKVAGARDVDDLYFLVLYPASYGKPDDATVFQKGTANYRQNSGLDANRDGRVTVAETAERIRAMYREGIENTV